MNQKKAKKKGAQPVALLSRKEQKDFFKAILDFCEEGAKLQLSEEFSLLLLYTSYQLYQEFELERANFEKLFSFYEEEETRKHFDKHQNRYLFFLVMLCEVHFPESGKLKKYREQVVQQPASSEEEWSVICQIFSYYFNT